MNIQPVQSNMHFKGRVNFVNPKDASNVLLKPLINAFENCGSDKVIHNFELISVKGSDKETREGVRILSSNVLNGKPLALYSTKHEGVITDYSHLDFLSKAVDDAVKWSKQLAGILNQKGL